MTSNSRRWVYYFGQGRADAGSDDKAVVGGKGASLAEMTRAGLNVPPGFTISAECCDHKNQGRWPDGLDAEVRRHLARLEEIAARPFGKGEQPLLVAVRSGAAQSMPGMMDTVLNVGLNPDCVQAMGQRTKNPRGAWEAYLHFQRMYLRTVSNIPDADLQARNREVLERLSISREDDLNADQLQTLCGGLADLHRERLGFEFPTDPWNLLRAAIDAVFASWMSERAVIYRKSHGIDGLLGTAVNLQMMCPSEVSGVMFTAHPVQPALGQMIVESAYGLGEAVVLGKVTPDRFVLDDKTGAILERHIARKETRVATLAADGQGQTGAIDEASLRDEQIAELAQLGLRVAKYFGHPCDIEWALSQGQFYLLQSRAIKSSSVIDPSLQEKVRQEEITALRAAAAPNGTVWSRFNLSEILAEPTPLTWSIVQRFMSGTGGFGLMYRDLGYTPHPDLDHLSTYDLIAGRVYCNLTREPRMQFGTLPFAHSFKALKENPAQAIYPQAIFQPRQASWKFWLFFPINSVKLWWGESKRQHILRNFASDFQEHIVPQFLAEVDSASKEDWEKLATPALLEKLNFWIRRTLTDFARESLKPTALAAILLAKFEAAFAKRFQPPGKKLAPGETPGLERAQAAMRELTMGVHPPADADLPRALELAALGKMDRAEFLAKFGHRGSLEMELSQPRWAEDPKALEGLLHPSAHREPPTSHFLEIWEKIAKELKLQSFQSMVVERELRILHQFLGLREAGKHYMLRGYALIRRALLELGRRWGLADGIFLLTLDEVAALGKGTQSAEALKPIIEERRERRRIALSLPVPQVIYSDDLEAVGREIVAGSVDQLQGTPLSAGIGEAKAWVLDTVAGATPPAEPYILVCPTTDPAWVPLFAQARGLVMETGGVLSHGAIVARDYGLPAVAGIPDVHRRLKTGQRLQIDGAKGIVRVLGDEPQRATR